MKNVDVRIAAAAALASIGMLGMLAMLDIGCSSQECHGSNDCDLNEVCSGAGACVAAPVTGLRECVEVDVPGVLDSQHGFLSDADQWSCPPIQPVGGDGAVIDGVDGFGTVPSGGVVRFAFSWSGEENIDGRRVFFGITGEPASRGEQYYYAKELAQSGVTSPILVELFVRPDIPSGTHTFFIGLDDGTGTEAEPHPRAFFRAPLNVIGVAGGDLQINLSWDSDVDADLHVFSPTGEEVFYANPHVGSGGTLDLDSNVGCPHPGNRAENIFWPDNSAIDGTYEVHAALFSACQPAVQVTHYHVTILRQHQVFSVVDGTLDVAEVDTSTAGELVTTVSWPP
jgi:hypothetical protein